MKELFEQDIEQEIRLPWDTICRLAVMAFVAGVSIDTIVEQALRSRIASLSRQAA